jgi:hypothetical protein
LAARPWRQLSEPCHRRAAARTARDTACVVEWVVQVPRASRPSRVHEGVVEVLQGVVDTLARAISDLEPHHVRRDVVKEPDSWLRRPRAADGGRLEDRDRQRDRAGVRARVRARGQINAGWSSTSSGRVAALKTTALHLACTNYQVQCRGRESNPHGVAPTGF